jgi:hypothetical protein
MIRNSDFGDLQIEKDRSFSAKVVLLVLELLAFAVSIFYLRAGSWDLSFILLSLLAVVSHVFPMSAFDYITGVRIYNCAHLIPLFAIYVVYGPAEAFFVNALAHILGAAAGGFIGRRVYRYRAARSAESSFVFLAVFYAASILLAFLTKYHVLKNLILAAIVIVSFIAHIFLEACLSRATKELNIKSACYQTIEIGMPYYTVLVSILIAVSVLDIPQAAITFWFLAHIVWFFYARSLREKRVLPAKTIDTLATLTLKNEEEEKARNQSLEYGRKIIHELQIKDRDFDSTYLALLLHDFGKAGIDIYSVDSVIEDIRASRGEPLHAERASEFSRILREFPEVEEILRYHHKYHEKELFSRSKRNLRLFSSIVNVSTGFAELLKDHKEELYTERDAFKDLKKESGWEYDPKVLRALKKILMKKGYTKL